MRRFKRRRLDVKNSGRGDYEIGGIESVSGCDGNRGRNL